MTPSDFVLIACAVVQAITAVVIAIATVHYAKTTYSLLAAQRDPSVSLGFYGTPGGYGIRLRNETNSTLTSITVVLSVHFPTDDGRSIAKCLFASELKKPLKAWQSTDLGFALTGSLSEFDELPGKEKAYLTLDYEFVRNADRQRFSYSLPVSTVDAGSGNFFPYCSQDPTRIRSLERIILTKSEAADDPIEDAIPA